MYRIILLRRAPEPGERLDGFEGRHKAERYALENLELAENEFRLKQYGTTEERMRDRQVDDAAEADTSPPVPSSVPNDNDGDWNE